MVLKDLTPDDYVDRAHDPHNYGGDHLLGDPNMGNLNMGDHNIGEGGDPNAYLITSSSGFTSSRTINDQNKRKSSVYGEPSKELKMRPIDNCVTALRRQEQFTTPAQSTPRENAQKQLEPSLQRIQEEQGIEMRHGERDLNEDQRQNRGRTNSTNGRDSSRSSNNQRNQRQTFPLRVRKNQ